MKQKFDLKQENQAPEAYDQTVASKGKEAVADVDSGSCSMRKTMLPGVYLDKGGKTLCFDNRLIPEFPRAKDASTAQVSLSRQLAWRLLEDVESQERIPEKGRQIGCSVRPKSPCNLSVQEVLALLLAAVKTVASEAESRQLLRPCFLLSSTHLPASCRSDPSQEANQGTAANFRVVPKSAARAGQSVRPVPKKICGLKYRAPSEAAKGSVINLARNLDGTNIICGFGHPVRCRKLTSGGRLPRPSRQYNGILSGSACTSQVSCSSQGCGA